MAKQSDSQQTPEPAAPPAIKRRCYTVGEFCEAFRTSRAATYRRLKSGEIRSVRIAGRRLIPVSEGDRLLEVAE